MIFITINEIDSQGVLFAVAAGLGKKYVTVRVRSILSFSRRFTFGLVPTQRVPFLP